MATMIQAVLFDLFETLVTERDRPRIPAQAVAQALGIDEEIYRTEWRKRQVARMTGVFPGYACAVQDMCAALGRQVAPEAVQRLESQRLASFTNVFANPNAGLRTALLEIRGLGIRTAVVSNASPDEIAGYQGAWLSELMDAAIFSCEAGCMKPGPEIYLAACEKLGANPRNCVYVGDGGFDELPGAAALGMTVCCATWYRDRWPEPGSAPYPKLSHPSQLVPAVKDDAIGTQRS